MALVIQKEVAEDYASRAKKASFIANYAQLFSDLEIVEIIPKDEFYPEPKVDGAVLVFKNIRQKFEQGRELVKFIKNAYSSPRKKLSSNLANLGFDKARVETWLTTNGLTVTARAGELTIEQWHKLFLAINTK
jgi:16S rRNA (adenine1518-N6/adenine1519-N6)-dimethyltransferase